MSYSNDLAKWQSYAEARGLKKGVYQPPFDRLLKALGCECPPVIFWKFDFVAIAMGLPFGVFLGSFMYFIVLKEPDIKITLIDSSLVGIFFGISMAWIHSRAKKRLGLTTWEDFKRQI